MKRNDLISMLGAILGDILQGATSNHSMAVELPQPQRLPPPRHMQLTYAGETHSDPAQDIDVLARALAYIATTSNGKYHHTQSDTKEHQSDVKPCCCCITDIKIETEPIDEPYRLGHAIRIEVTKEISGGPWPSCDCKMAWFEMDKHGRDDSYSRIRMAPRRWYSMSRFLHAQAVKDLYDEWGMRSCPIPLRDDYPFVELVDNPQLPDYQTFHNDDTTPGNGEKETEILVLLMSCTESTIMCQCPPPRLCAIYFKQILAVSEGQPDRQRTRPLTVQKVCL